MGYNGSGVYTLPAGTIVSDGTSADAADINTPFEDLEDSMNLAFLRDGRAPATGNFPMGTNKITGLGSGTAATDAAALSQVQTGVVAHAATVGGTADAIEIAFSPANTAWTSKEIIRWTSGGANTVTNPTISKDAGSTTKTIKKAAGAALVAGDTGASGYVCVGVYNGTDVILINPASGASAASTSQAGVSELATNAEALGMSDTGRTITPSNLAAFFGKGSDIASASTITIGDGGYFDVTGTTSITDIDLTVDFNGRPFELQFDDALTLTHSSTLILPGAADITTAAGDVAKFRSEGSDVVRCVKYQRASVPPAGNGWNVFSYEALTVGSTEYDVTGLGNATHVRLTFIGIELSTPRNIHVRTSSDGGSTYDSTAGNYKNNNSNAAHILVGTTTGLTVYGVSTFYNFGTASKMAVRHDIQELAATNAAAATTVSTCELTVARDALRVLLNSTGTFQAGAIMVETWTP